VPEGLIIGPLLVLIYINDLVAVSSTVFHILFADDTNLILSHNNYDSLINETTSGMATKKLMVQDKQIIFKCKKSAGLLYSLVRIRNILKKETESQLVGMKCIKSHPLDSSEF
jgi:hypothetical protein